MTTQILVTISRTWTDFETLRRVLGTAYAAHPDAVLVHGDAPQGDRTAATYWKRLGGTDAAVPAAWKTCAWDCPRWHKTRRYCPDAGFRRNTVMAQSGVDLCLSFIRSGSRGATDCTEKAEAAGVRTVRYTQDDEPEQAVQLTMEGNTDD